MSSRANYWVVVPAAGIGSRMNAPVPKQYLKLAGRCVIEHTLARLCAHPKIGAVIVSLSADDEWWREIDTDRFAKPIISVLGGAERCHSVLNGLRALAERAAGDDWVLVHDAARPCLRVADIDRLVELLQDHPVGGLLGLPVADTMKRTDGAGEVVETVSRDALWRALTPQMFRLEMLTQALERALKGGFLVTDEASAMEHGGHRPLMVEGHADNIKITRPQDLALAEIYLQQQQEVAE